MIKRKLSKCSSIGKLMILIGFFVIFPVLIMPVYMQDKEFIPAFLIPGAASVLLGFIICIFTKKESFEKTSWRDSVMKSSLTVVFAWLWGVLIGALPFYFGGQLTFIQSVFEAVSGWTTTGLSTMDVSITPMIYLFHRSFMQYCGGLGFILMMMVIITNKQSAELYTAEGHPDRIMPNIRKTSRMIFLIYNFCLLVGTIAYRIAGMPVFDGVCHAMCSLSTGGFSTKLGSIGEYDSVAIEAITIILMIIGTTNFAALILLAKGKIKAFSKISEVRFMCLVFAIFIPLTAWSLSDGLNISYLQGLRKAAFDLVSALSTSGYSTMSYENWPQAAITIMILMMLIGGGMGSTAGGLKLTRVYLLLRMGMTNIRRRLSPTNDVEAPYYIKAQGRAAISKDVVEDTIGYFVTYILIFLTGSILITVTADCTITAAMFDFSSAIGTVGLSMGITNPMTNNATLIIEIVGMLLGRLEIFIVLTGIVSVFRKAAIKTSRIFEKQKAK